MQIEIHSPASVDAVMYVMRQVHGEDFERRLLGRSLKELLNDEGFHAIVTTADSVPIASIILHAVPHLLIGLCTAEGFRRRGFASQLIDRALLEARTLQARAPIFAAIEIGSVWEKERYEARGFRLIHDDVLKGYLLLACGLRGLAMPDSEAEIEIR